MLIHWYICSNKAGVKLISSTTMLQTPQRQQNGYDPKMNGHAVRRGDQSRIISLMSPSQGHDSNEANHYPKDDLHFQKEQQNHYLKNQINYPRDQDYLHPKHRDAESDVTTSIKYGFYSLSIQQYS